jgi:hypothetical protein
VQLAALGFLPESREFMVDALTPARILLLRGDTRAVENVLARVYPLATKGDVARKVEIMARAVAQSVEVEKTTSVRERAASLFRVGAYRRALGASAAWVASADLSHRVRAAGVAAGVWVQHVNGELCARLALTGSTSRSRLAFMFLGDGLTTAPRPYLPRWGSRMPPRRA